MIRDTLGASKLPTKSALLVALAMQADITFYLTGSHFFGCARPDSDIDFIVQDTPLVRARLIQLGFADHDLLDGYAEDRGLTNEVWECVQDGITVQVQLCADALLKRDVRDLVERFHSDTHPRFNREERAKLWGGLAELLRMRPMADKQPVSSDDELLQF
jgi:hypothetical protein